MKNKKFISSIILFFGFAIFFTGCKKDDEATEQEIAFHIHNKVGTSVADYNSTYSDASGRQFNLSDFRYYISEIVLIKKDGEELPLTDKVLLVNANHSDYDLGLVPTGDYKGFRFLIGLDSTVNHSDPTVYEASNPLAMQTPSIYWSWNSGYIFFKVEGLVDSTAAGNAAPNKAFFYHVGLDENKRTIDFSNTPFTVSGDAKHEITLTFNLATVLANVDMATQTATHSMGAGAPLANTIANSWQSAFTVE